MRSRYHIKHDGERNRFIVNRYGEDGIPCAIAMLPYEKAALSESEGRITIPVEVPATVRGTVTTGTVTKSEARMLAQRFVQGAVEMFDPRPDIEVDEE